VFRLRSVSPVRPSGGGFLPVGWRYRAEVKRISTFRASIGFVRDDGQTRLVVRSGESSVSTGKGVHGVKAGQEATIGQDVSIAAYAGKAEDSSPPPAPMTEEEQQAGVPPAAAYELRDYGEWVNSSDYGYVWRPRVADDWSPYYYGRWVWVSPYGWTWVAYEPWGWYPYHFGWWASDPFFGWVWCPFRSFVSVNFFFGNFRFAHFHRNAFFFPANVRFVRTDVLCHCAPGSVSSVRSPLRYAAGPDQSAPGARIGLRQDGQEREERVAGMEFFARRSPHGAGERTRREIGRAGIRPVRFWTRGSLDHPPGEPVPTGRNGSSSAAGSARPRTAARFPRPGEQPGSGGTSSSLRRQGSESAVRTERVRPPVMSRRNGGDRPAGWSLPRSGCGSDAKLRPSGAGAARRATRGEFRAQPRFRASRGEAGQQDAGGQGKQDAGGQGGGNPQVPGPGWAGD
jgi:hypothetical protein